VLFNFFLVGQKTRLYIGKKNLTAENGICGLPCETFFFDWGVELWVVWEGIMNLGLSIVFARLAQLVRALC
jgi:hypothetical protein